MYNAGNVKWGETTLGEPSGTITWSADFVDDLIIAPRNPQSIIDQLQSKPHAFKLKGTGPIDYHLGCDYFRDEDGTLCVGPKKYIE